MPRRGRHGLPPPSLVLPALLLAVGAGSFAGLATVPAAAGRPVDSPLGPAAFSLLEQDVSIPASVRPQQLRLPVPAAASRGSSATVAAYRSASPSPRAQPTSSPPPPPPSRAPAAVRRIRPTASPAGVRVAHRSTGRCPVPSSSFTDTWGAPRPGGRPHQGTDMLAAVGAPVYAVASGSIRTRSGGIGGLALWLRSEGGDTYYYAHNSALLVTNSARVVTGALIARVGATGDAQGGPSHVHFELHPGGGGAVDPYGFLRGLCGR